MSQRFQALRDGLLAARSPSWAAGVVLALLIVVGYAFGLPVLLKLEGSNADWLWTSGRIDPPPGSDKVVHLDIDDGALNTVGRWPWPRRRIADAVRMIDELGARVIVLDILLIDPQEGGTDDDVLAQTLRQCRATTVLAVHATEKARLGKLWQSAAGRRSWSAVRNVLRRDITLEADEIVTQAKLTAVYAAQVQEFTLGLKELVVSELATEFRRRGELSVENLEQTLVPATKRKRNRRFAEQRIMHAAVRREQSEQALERRLPKAQPGAEYAQAHEVIPPLTKFAEAVSAIGVSNANTDHDGRLRRVTIRWERRGFVYPQLGVAAAAAYLRIPSESLAAAPFAVDQAQAGFQLESEDLLLAWPRIDPARPIQGLSKHTSLGQILGLFDEEREVVRPMEARYLEITRNLLRDNLPDVAFEAGDLKNPTRRKEIEDEIFGEAKFRLDENLAVRQEDHDDAGGALTQLLALEGWVNRHRELERARRIFGKARERLHKTVADKLVLVGWSATGNFGDFFLTAAHERTPGVVAHGVAAGAIIEGYVFKESPLWVGILLTGLLGVLAAFLTDRLDPRISLLAVLVVGGLLFAFNTLIAFGRWRIIVATTTPLASITFAWASTLLLKTIKEKREKAQLKRQFGARISRRLFDHLLDNPDQIHMEGEEREVTCFFSDLAGFTSISERLDSRATVALLNRYMWAMNDELTQLSAYVNKFLGDGIMAVWGCFVVDTPHAERACRAALRCGTRLEKLNASPDLQDLPRLRMRIGIATGVVTVGDCGAPPDLRDYTVIGDTANLAARLESANKQFGTRILINGRTREMLPDDILCRSLGTITVVGQTQTTEIHAVVAESAQATPADYALIESTEKAVALFRDGRLEEARLAWHAQVQQHGESPLATVYLAETERLLAEGDAAESDGVLRLTHK